MFILQIITVLSGIKIAGHISVKLGQPSVLGKIIIGIILGPAVLNFVENSEIISVFSGIGVILLMFLAGLETDLKELNKNKKASTLVAFGGVILPILLSYFGSLYFGLSKEQAIFVGLVLAATSVSISVQTLQELGKLKTKVGSVLLGAAVLDDIIVIILLSIAMSFLSGEEISYVNLFGGKIIFFIGLFLVSKYLVKHFLKLFSKLQVSEPIITGALILCFTFAYIGEHFFDIATIIGAFFAGIAISQTEFKHIVEEKTLPIANGIFVPFFFVSIGLSVSFDGIGESLVFLVVFIVISILSKLFGSGIGSLISGLNFKDSLAIGAGMISRGEVALILLATGLTNGLVSDKYYTSLVLVVIVTTIVTPPLLKALTKHVDKTN